MSDVVLNGVAATVWVLREDGKYEGCVVENGGELTDLGVALARKHSTEEAARELVANASVEHVEDSLSECKKTEAPADFQRVCGESMMAAQAREIGHYCYVMEGGMWYAGALSRRSLNEIVRFIERA